MRFLHVTRCWGQLGSYHSLEAACFAWQACSWVSVTAREAPLAVVLCSALRVIAAHVVSYPLTSETLSRDLGFRRQFLQRQDRHTI